jgi:hypothetical protein
MPGTLPETHRRRSGVEDTVWLVRLARLKISAYPVARKSIFETARLYSILHRERIVYNSDAARIERSMSAKSPMHSSKDMPGIVSRGYFREADLNEAGFSVATRC